MRRITWIASFPKSGNTWVRVFLEHLMSAGAQVNINELGLTGFSASSRHLFDQFSAIRAADLTHDEIATFRPEVYRHVARLPGRQIFFKAHDRFQPELFPADVSSGAIYLIRNPLDVAVSYAFHLSAAPDFDDVIDRMASEGHGTASRADRLGQHLPVAIGDWSRHVSGWCDKPSFPVLVVRYEDLLADRAASFARIGALVDPAPTADDVAQAVSNSEFRGLREQERLIGFKERGHESAAFFRAGREGDWRRYLDTRQVERIVASHRATMQRFGYADDEGQPVAPSSPTR